MEDNVNDYGEVEARLSKTNIIKCDSCGSNMIYEPKRGVIYCEHCGASRKIETVRTNERDFDYRPTNKVEDGRQSFRCANCGAVTVFARGEIATTCPFCGAANTQHIDEMPGITPTAIIPFAISKDDSKQFYLKWIKKRIFAPRVLKKTFTVDKMSGVYIPCWTFDTNTVSRYEGRLGETYTVTVGTGKNSHTVTKVRWFRVSGIYERFFDDLTIEDSSYISQKSFDKISPFNTNNANVFDASFMAGFKAERYRTGIDECFKKAQEVIQNTVRKAILNRYHADKVDYLNVNTQYNDKKYKYVVVPTWICSYQYKAKPFNFFVNGQTGKTYGTYPKSPIKVGFAVLLGLIVLAGLIYYFLCGK